MLVKGPMTGMELLEFLEMKFECQIDFARVDNIPIFEKSMFNEDFLCVKPKENLSDFQNKIYVQKTMQTRKT